MDTQGRREVGIFTGVSFDSRIISRSAHLEEYLASPDEVDFEMNLLKFWKDGEIKWPALAKMAKQYAGALATVSRCSARALGLTLFSLVTV